MFFWFIGTAVLAIGWVFKDPRFDYRLLIVGSVLPLVDGFFGGARALHSLTTAVALLAVLMLATSGRKPIRRTLLGLPIGVMMHLVFGSAWSDTETFWWPFTGVDFTSTELPMLSVLWFSAILEVGGIVLCVWLWRRYGLGDADRRRWFAKTGQLIDVRPPTPAT